MPTLKQITVSLVLGPNDTTLKEYGHQYNDGGVEAFICVPETNIPFHVHVSSSGYVAPGLAAYVFMDGEYQCNRNRQRLRIPAHGVTPSEYEINFKLRQKEERIAHSTFVGREWVFSRLKTENADRAPNSNSRFALNVGTIEVVILRCKDGGIPRYMPAPAFSTIAPAGNSSMKGYSSAPARKSGAAPAKTSCKTPFQIKYKAKYTKPSTASSKEISGTVDDHILGGMIGLFDGAGDDPNGECFAPGCYHCSCSMVPLSHDRCAHVPCCQFDVQHHRPQRTGLLHNMGRPETSMGRFDSEQHREAHPEHMARSPAPVLGQVNNSAQYGKHKTAIEKQARSRALLRNSSNDCDFIVDLCMQVESLLRLSSNEQQKAAGMRQEIHMYDDDPELYFAAAKTIRHHEQAVMKLEEEGTALYNSIFARMRRMDRESWSYCRDYLVLERRLIPADHPQLHAWPGSRAPHLASRSQVFAGQNEQSTRSSGAVDDRLQQVGNGQTGQAIPSLAERRMQQPKNVPRTDPSPCNNDGDMHGIDRSPLDWRQAGQKYLPTPNQDTEDFQKTRPPSPDNLDKPNLRCNGGVKNRQSDLRSRNRSSSTNRNKNSNDISQLKQDQVNQDSAWSRPGWGQQDNTGWALQSDTRSKSHKSQVNSWIHRSKDKPSGSGNQMSYSTAGKPQVDSEPAVKPVIKPYWATWNSPNSVSSTTKNEARVRNVYEYPAPPSILAPTGRANSVSHGVQAGKGAHYEHKTYRPDYLDTMQKPYAIFTFKYRSKAALEKILNRTIDTRDVQNAIADAERESLGRLSKDEIVRELMKLRLATKSEKPASRSVTGEENKDSEGWSRSPACAKLGDGGWNDDGKAAWREFTHDAWSAAKPDNGKAWNDNHDGSRVSRRRTNGSGSWKEASKRSSSGATTAHFADDQGLQATT